MEHACIWRHYEAAWGMHALGVILLRRPCRRLNLQPRLWHEEIAVRVLLLARVELSHEV